MRRLVFHPLVMLMTFLMGITVTFLIVVAGGLLARVLDEPSQYIPALCQSASDGVSTSCRQPPRQEDEEAAVYSALIDRMSEGERGALVVVQDRTVRGNSYLDDPSEDEHLNRIFASLQRDFPRADRETLESFHVNNLQHYPIEYPFLPHIKYELISQQEVERFSYREPGNWWEAFYRNHPGANGFFVLSKVGFNREMDQALVYRAFACGSTCGYGSYVLLAKEAGIWRIKSHAGDWIS
ncbi:MAG TPA: hypothetical protein VIW80_15180 [Pyrinomonadaceae bacterium]|jgi:hypothetical protein